MLGYLQCVRKFGSVPIVLLCCGVLEVVETLIGLNQGFSPSRQIGDKVELSLPNIGRLPKTWSKGYCRVWWIIEGILNLENILVGCVSPKDNLGQIGSFRLPLCIRWYQSNRKTLVSDLFIKNVGWRRWREGDPIEDH